MREKEKIVKLTGREVINYLFPYNGYGRTIEEAAYHFKTTRNKIKKLECDELRAIRRARETIKRILNA